jgi:hypothetical protein
VGRATAVGTSKDECRDDELSKGERIMDKEITVKQNGKVILEFIVSETELKIAAKLGITKENYIKEKVK